MIRFLCLLGLLVGGSATLWAADKPVIHWLSPNFPPVFIADGPLKRQGYGDQIVRYMSEKLPDYRHVPATANLTRTYNQMKLHDGVCSVALFETPERAAFANFSDDVYHVMTNRVVVMNRNLHRFKPYLNAAGEVDITRLLTASDLAVGVVPDRFYSQLINDTLKAVGMPDNMVVIPFNRYGALLDHGRIDYTFGFPAEAYHQFSKLGKAEAFVALPIAGEARFQSGGFSCSDKPLGRKVIAEINRLIATEEVSAVYDAFYEQWLDARSLKDYRKLRAAMQR
ncbi:TIGR02285 family protein [Kordiimonas lacus]|uniref:TIGR02285 family protein n=1 Tax=Kordiimonas lacus TaxID=637679 RepID=UPI000834000F|nr:TIGR02285 family protein [Kordiimonas lacus]